MADRTQQTIRLYEDTRGFGTCRGCESKIQWFETISGRKMPMESDAVAMRTEHEPSTRRLIGIYWASDSHWPHCVARDRFK